jgi:glycerol-3-phosphate acyltransferase PlsY
LVGSIPFGYLIVRLKEGADVRATGSGGTGATNVSRRAGKAAGIVTLILDVLKGAAAVLIARAFVHSSGADQSGELVAAAAMAAIIGHIFPVWLRFRGGKGVATGVGVFLVLSPLAVLGAGIIFAVVFLLTRYVSLSSMTAAATLPVFVWLQDRFVWPDGAARPLLTAAIVGAGLIVYAHRGNVSRLLSGTESKFR